MASFLCVTCGTEFPESASPPDSCSICQDERQYVGLRGQQWTTAEELRRQHRNQLTPLETGLTSIRTEPQFAINQRALLVETPEGNVLFDCVALLDEATTASIRQRGGLQAIAISHPHYYTTMGTWSEVFGNVPVYLHQADREHVVNCRGNLQFWDGENRLLAHGLTLIRCGGHFEGGSVLHWAAGAEGRGALLSGDIIQVVPDRRFVSFMYSYPNLIPLNARTVKRIVAAVEPYSFERVYGAFEPMQVMSEGKAAVRRSAERYLRAIAD